MRDEPILGCPERKDDEQSRCNPFGTRFLTDDSRVFEHNAWDNVEWSEEQREEAQKIVDKQKDIKLDEQKAEELLKQPADQWDAFYTNNENKFFKDRNWLLKEFPELDAKNGPIRVLEVGCGVGNTTFPLMEVNDNKNIFLYSCDYSQVAVNVLKSNQKYDETNMKAFVWDITQPNDTVPEASLDYVVCIYVLSAIHPSKVATSIQNIVRLLKPGGQLLLKDYGRYDLTQLRFKKDRLIDDNFYCRGDGTLVYFFTLDEIEKLLSDVSMVKISLHMDRRLIVNRLKQNKKALLRLAAETLKFQSVFEEILSSKDFKKLKHDPAIEGSKELLYVLLYESLVGSGLNRCSPDLKNVVWRRIDKIREFEQKISSEGRGLDAIKEKSAEAQAKTIKIPRYARINLLKWTKEEAVKAINEDQWTVKEVPDVTKFAETVSKLKKKEVLIDPHVDDLLIFPTSGNFHEHWMVQEKYLILQDKASCLPAFLLQPTPGSEVFDCCAAPGNKTSHAAALMGNKGKIWAMDRSSERMTTMKNLIRQAGVTCASAYCGDFLKTDVNDKKFANVEYAIVDPPCSGSGIVKRMDEVTGGNAETGRLEKLQKLQAMMLKHALKFPELKRAVYSTCSIHEQENEHVVDEVMLDTYVKQNFELKKNVLPSWKHRGLDTYEVGPSCLRADPAVTLTNGFFVAVFERIKN